MKGQVLKMMGISLRNFRSELAKEFIIPNKNDRKSLRSPPMEFPSIKDADWKLFVDKVLSEEFQVRLNFIVCRRKTSTLLIKYFLTLNFFVGEKSASEREKGEK